MRAHDIRVRQGSTNVTLDIEGLTGSGTSATNVRVGGSVVNYTSSPGCTTPPILP